MDVIEAIHTRRSIRQYTDQPVSDETVEELLKAAMMAPSAGNEQPWHFIVIRDRSILNRIPSAHPYAEMAPSAQLAILVCGDVKLERYKGFWVQDCSAATQNLLLAAHAMGLGAVWCGVYPAGDRVEGIVRLMGLPENVIPFALIPLGYPAEKKPTPDRFDKTRIRYEKW